MAYNNIKLKVGLFILFLFLNLLGVVYYILIKKGTFDKKYNYTFTSFSADSFSVGMPIKVSGFAIGTVDKIELLDNGNVKFSFSVTKENHKWISKGSLIMINKPLLGSAQIILYSAIGNPVLEDGSSIDAIVSNDINDLILSLNPIVSKMTNIVNSVDKITSYLAKDDSELMKIIKNLETFSSLLVENKSLLTTITGDKKSTEAFIETINKLPLVLKDINKISSNVNTQIVPQLSNFLEDLGKISKDIEKKLQNLDSFVNTLSSSDKDIVQIREDVKSAIGKSNKIIEKVDSLLQSQENKRVILP